MSEEAAVKENHSDPMELSTDELAELTELEKNYEDNDIPSEMQLLIVAEEWLGHRDQLMRVRMSAKANQAVGNTSEHKRLSDIARASATVVALIEKKYSGAKELGQKIATIRARARIKEISRLMLGE